MKKLLCLFFVLCFVLCGCAGEDPSSTAATEEAAANSPVTVAAESADPIATSPVDVRTTKLVHILLPDANSSNWKAAGEDLLMMLENLFYQVELHYADGSPVKQAKQITDAIEQKADALVLAPVESASLHSACAEAIQAGIPIISYNRLLMDTDAVSCYISFDYQAMGRALATEIVSRAGLETLAEGEVRTIEFFMGSPEDNNTLLLYLGIMEILEPWLHQGTLVSLSGRTALEDTCVVDWDADWVARSFSDYRKEYYDGGVPDIICTVSDEFANACISRMEENPPEVYPLITGLGGSKTAVQQLSDGLLTVTASTDLLQLNDQLAATVDAFLTGKEPEFNNPDACHNNAITVPAYLCDFEIMTKTEN